MFDIAMHSVILFLSFRLCEKTDRFLLAYKGNSLSSSEKWEFVNFWYLTIIINDVLAIIGSFSKILMETKVNRNNVQKKKGKKR